MILSGFRSPLPSFTLAETGGNEKRFCSLGRTSYPASLVQLRKWRASESVLEGAASVSSSPENWISRTWSVPKQAGVRCHVDEMVNALSPRYVAPTVCYGTADIGIVSARPDKEY